MFKSFLTAKSSVEDEKIGLELGASDYIIKPISLYFTCKIKTQLENKAANDFMKDKNRLLREDSKRLKERLQQSKM